MTSRNFRSTITKLSADMQENKQELVAICLATTILAVAVVLSVVS